MTRLPQAAESGAPTVAGTRKVVFSAIGVLATSMLFAMVSYAWNWSGLLHGRRAGPDQWVALAGTLWLAVVAVTVHRLLKVHRALAATAQDAVDAFQDTVHTAHGWVWRIDTDHRIVYASEGVETLLGYEPEEVIGRNAVDLLVLDEDRPAIMAGIEVSKEQGGWRNWQTRVKHRDGTVRHVRSSATPVHDVGGRLLAYRGFTADVTAEVAAASAEQQRLLEEQAARTRVEQALADPDGLRIAVQPIVEVATQRIVGMEALSRFTGPAGRTPDVWFAEAWRVGLGTDLELHAIALACEYIPRLADDVYLSVNTSPQTLMDERFGTLLRRLGANAYRIVVEVTEHAAVADYDDLALTVERLRHTGVRFAVDDAGAGYASMQHILRLRPDIIKLDRGIIADIDHDVAKRALVTAMAGFADSLDMTVVAEGVENAGELAVLIEAGVRCAQGYFLGRPAADPAPQLLSSAL